MCVFPGSELRHKSERNDLNQSSTISFDCEANLKIASDLGEVMGTFSEGSPRLDFKGQGEVLEGKAPVTVRRRLLLW